MWNVEEEEILPGCDRGTGLRGKDPGSWSSRQTKTKKSGAAWRKKLAWGKKRQDKQMVHMLRMPTAGACSRGWASVSLWTSLLISLQVVSCPQDTGATSAGRAALCPAGGVAPSEQHYGQGQHLCWILLPKKLFRSCPGNLPFGPSRRAGVELERRA